MTPAWVNDYVGLPFRSLGRDRAGVDCWGLVCLVYREQFGREIPAYSESYASAYDRAEIDALIRGATATPDWQRVERGKEALGDLVLIRCGGRPTHVGIVVDPREKKFLHSQGEPPSFAGQMRSATPSCTDRWDELTWRNRILGFYRYAGC
ncbi:MAG: NlpC/P60 family protein [Candidatus Binatus sp.]